VPGLQHGDPTRSGRRSGIGIQGWLHLEGAVRTWEIDVEMRVRKTLVIEAPVSEEQARSIAKAMLQSWDFAGVSASPFVKWSDGRRSYRPMPLETIVDNDPQIVAVREVSDG
jgi:hypothetical protein